MKRNKFILIGILMILIAGESISAAGMSPLYTVQTGTYVPVEPARKQFDTLTASLARPLRGLLRIERGARFHVVRLGLFNDPAEALKAARSIGTVAPDAFVLREPAGTVDRLVLIAPGISGAEQRYAVDAGCFVSKDAAMGALKTFGLEFGGGQASAKLVGDGSDSVIQVDGLAGMDSAWNIIRRMATVSACVSVRKSEEPKPDDTVKASSVKPEPVIAAEAKMEPLPKAEPAADRPADSATDSATGDTTGDTTGDMTGDSTEDMEKTFVRINDTMSAMLDQHEYGKAVQVIREYMKRFPDNPDLYAWYGAALSAMDRPDKALEQYRKAAELAPSVPEFHINVGQSLTKIHMNSVKDAIDSFNAALRLNPNNVDALEGLGSVYVSIGYRDMAEDLVLPRIQELDSEAAKRLDTLIKGGVDWSR